MLQIDINYKNGNYIKVTSSTKVVKKNRRKTQESE